MPNNEELHAHVEDLAAYYENAKTRFSGDKMVRIDNKVSRFLKRFTPSHLLEKWTEKADKIKESMEDIEDSIDTAENANHVDAKETKKLKKEYKKNRKKLGRFVFILGTADEIINKPEKDESEKSENPEEKPDELGENPTPDSQKKDESLDNSELGSETGEPNQEGPTGTIDLSGLPNPMDPPSDMSDDEVMQSFNNFLGGRATTDTFGAGDNNSPDDPVATVEDPKPIELGDLPNPMDPASDNQDDEVMEGFNNFLGGSNDTFGTGDSSSSDDPVATAGEPAPIDLDDEEPNPYGNDTNEDEETDINESSSVADGDDNDSDASSSESTDSENEELAQEQDEDPFIDLEDPEPAINEEPTFDIQEEAGAEYSDELVDRYGKEFLDELMEKGKMAYGDNFAEDWKNADIDGKEFLATEVMNQFKDRGVTFETPEDAGIAEMYASQWEEQGYNEADINYLLGMLREVQQEKAITGEDSNSYKEAEDAFMQEVVKREPRKEEVQQDEDVVTMIIDDQKVTFKNGTIIASEEIVPEESQKNEEYDDKYYVDSNGVLQYKDAAETVTEMPREKVIETDNGNFAVDLEDGTVRKKGKHEKETPSNESILAKLEAAEEENERLKEQLSNFNALKAMIEELREKAEGIGTISEENEQSGPVL